MRENMGRKEEEACDMLRGKVSVCVCVCVRERERERRRSIGMLESCNRSWNHAPHGVSVNFLMVDTQS